MSNCLKRITMGISNILTQSIAMIGVIALLFSTVTVATAADDVSVEVLPASKLTLENCIAIALENNPEIIAKKWDIETAFADKDILHSKRLPQIGIVGGYTHYMDDQRLTKPRSPGELLPFTDDIISGDIVVSMPLYTGGKLINEVESAKFIGESQTHKYFRNRRELVFNVSSVFYSMLGQRKVIDSLEFSKIALDEHYKRTVQLLKAKKAAKVDLLRTEVRLADIQQQLLRERNVFKVQGFVLASMLGLERDVDVLEIQGDLAANKTPLSFDQTVDDTLKKRRDYQAMLAIIESKQSDVKVAKAQRMPDIAFQASYGNRWSAGDTRGGNDRSLDVGEVGVVAVIPLFEGGKINAGIRREKSHLRAAQESLRKLQLQIILEVKTSVANIESTYARIAVAQKAQEQAKESLRIEREKYDYNKGTIVDVLDAQSALLHLQTNYFRALADYNTALAQYKLAIGEISE